jgi:hypothetical protein
MGKTTLSRQQRRAHLQGVVKPDQKQNPLVNFQNFQIHRIGNERKVVADNYAGKMKPIDISCLPKVKSWKEVIGYTDLDNVFSEVGVFKKVTKVIPWEPVTSENELRRVVVVDTQIPEVFSGKFEQPIRKVELSLDTMFKECNINLDIPIVENIFQPKEIEQYGTADELLKIAKEKSDKQMKSFLDTRKRCCGEGEEDVELNLNCDSDMDSL